MLASPPARRCQSARWLALPATDPVTLLPPDAASAGVLAVLEFQYLRTIAPEVAPERQQRYLDEVPKTSVGKFSKKTLRERFATGVPTS